MKLIGDRTTFEIVVLVLTCVVAFSVTFLVIGAVIMRLIHPAAEMKPAGELIANIVSTIVGTLLGFIGGRAQGRLEANGEKT
jgi:hypothetical protein